MLSAARLPIRPKAQQALGWAYLLYGVLTLGSMAMMSIGAALVLVTLLWTLGLPGLRELWGELRRPPLLGYARAASALFGACALSLIVAHYAPIRIDENQVQVRFLSDLAKGWYLFWPLLLAPGLGLLTELQRQRVFWSWIGAFGVLSAVGVAQYFTGWPRPQIIPGLEGRFHATLLLGHHLSVASVWIFPFFAALDSLIVPSRSSRARPLLAVACALGLATLFFTYSRMLWVALPVGLAVWMLGALPRRAAGAALIFLVLGGIALLSTPAVRDRVTNVMGIGPRQDLWAANLSLFQERPLTGAGWHHNLEAAGWVLQKKLQTQEVFSGHAHSNLIEFLGGMGIIGLLAWIYWWVVVIGLLLILPKNVFEAGGATGFGRGLACAWIVFHINGLTQVNFWESKVLHQLMWTLSWLLFWVISVRARARSAGAPA